MRYILLFLILSFTAGCRTTELSGNIYTQVVSVSSSSFVKAKYMTELAYITKDKELVKEFRKCYTERKCIDPKFKQLRKWAAGKERSLVIESIDLFLKATFYGE